MHACCSLAPYRTHQLAIAASLHRCSLQRPALQARQSIELTGRLSISVRHWSSRATLATLLQPEGPWASMAVPAASAAREHPVALANCHTPSPPAGSTVLQVVACICPVLQADRCSQLTTNWIQSAA